MDRLEINEEADTTKDKEETSSARDSTNQQNRVIEWTRPAITALMDGYRNHPCLYDTKHKHYYNKQARKEALEDVLARVSNVPIKKL